MKKVTENLMMRLICGAEKEAKSIPHLTARLASRFNSFRLFLAPRSASGVVGSGELGVRSLGRDEASVAKEKRWEIGGVLDAVGWGCGGEKRWWWRWRGTVAQVRWWWNHGHCLNGRNTWWVMSVLWKW